MKVIIEDKYLQIVDRQVIEWYFEWQVNEVVFSFFGVEKFLPVVTLLGVSVFSN